MSIEKKNKQTRSKKASSGLQSQHGYDVLTELEKIRSSPTFGELVKSLRLADDISQTELAQKLDLSKQHLSAIERGKKFVSVARAARFAEVLGYPVQQFVLASLQDELNEAGIELNFDLKQTV